MEPLPILLRPEPAQLMKCTFCVTVSEVNGEHRQAAIGNTGKSAEFSAGRQTMEISGCCPECLMPCVGAGHTAGDLYLGPCIQRYANHHTRAGNPVGGFWYVKNSRSQKELEIPKLFLALTK